MSEYINPVTIHPITMEAAVEVVSNLREDDYRECVEGHGVFPLHYIPLSAFKGDTVYFKMPNGKTAGLAGINKGGQIWMLCTPVIHEYPFSFAREAKKVIVDIDVAEIDKMQFDVDCQVVGDALGFINEMIAQKDGNDQNDFSWWLKKCKDWQHKYSVILPEYWEQDIGVNNYVLIDVLSDLMSSNDLLIPGSSGACSEVTMQAFRTKAGQRIFNSEGLGSMGFGIPAAIGGCVASGSKHTVCIDGDGGFVMNVQELETVRRLNLPIKFFVLNNGGYVSIRNTQNKHFELLVASGKTSGVTLPSIEKIAHSYNIEYCKVESHNNVRNNIQNVLESNGPVICEIMMLETHATMPRTSTYKDSDGNFVSAPMEDLYPFLPRDEFKENMIVKCVDE